ncbi:MAG TPA: hypothetical protein VIY86_09685 [Pirellulaceae bacterium]
MGVSMKVTALCSCGKTLQVPESYRGRNVACPKCKSSVMIPLAVGPMVELLGEIAIAAEKGAVYCPECRTKLQPDAVLCLKCGYHLEKERKLETKKIIEKHLRPGPKGALEAKGPPSTLSRIIDLVLGVVGIVLLLLGGTRLPTAYRQLNWAAPNAITQLAVPAGILVLGLLLCLVSLKRLQR